MAKVNYQYEKRQKELAKKRKKEEKLRLKQQKKNNPLGGTSITQQDEPAVDETSAEEVPTETTTGEKTVDPPK